MADTKQYVYVVVDEFQGVIGDAMVFSSVLAMQKYVQTALHPEEAKELDIELTGDFETDENAIREHWDGMTDTDYYHAIWYGAEVHEA